MEIKLADLIQQQQQHLGIDDRQAAERADVDLDVYLRYKHGEMRKVHTTTVAKIATALQTDASEMLRVAGVRRRRAKTDTEVKSPRAGYAVSASFGPPSTPADFAKIMLQRADQLEDEARQNENAAQSFLTEAQSLRATARELRSKANDLVTVS